MQAKPATAFACKLLLEGAKTMTRIENAGLRVDVPYLDRCIDQVKKTIAAKEEAIKEDEIYQLWGKVYGNQMKLDSKAQLGHIVFDRLGHKRNKFMGAKNDVAAFEHLKLPFLRD